MSCNSSDPNLRVPLVIAHRGASGYLPEHTLAAYALAIEMGADFIEPDVVSSKDGVLIARHENEISATTDVAMHSQFADRQTRKAIDGREVTGWFAEDFTLAELKTLRARERIPEQRPQNARFDGMFEIPTLDEVLDLVVSSNARFLRAARREGGPTPRRLGVYPETKHPSYHARIGLALEAPLLAALDRAGFRNSDDPVFIQSFEVGNLKRLRQHTDFPLIQLIEAADAQPWDLRESSDRRTYGDLISPAGLAEIARYADGIGILKDLLIPRNEAEVLGAPTRMIADAHAAGLLVHAWTFRAENAFLPADFRRGSEPHETGDTESEMVRFFEAGVDGVFSDQPDRAVAAHARFSRVEAALSGD